MQTSKSRSYVLAKRNSSFSHSQLQTLVVLNCFQLPFLAQRSSVKIKILENSPPYKHWSFLCNELWMVKSEKSSLGYQFFLENLDNQRDSNSGSKYCR